MTLSPWRGPKSSFRTFEPKPGVVYTDTVATPLCKSCFSDKLGFPKELVQTSQFLITNPLRACPTLEEVDLPAGGQLGIQLGILGGWLIPCVAAVLPMNSLRRQTKTYTRFVLSLVASGLMGFDYLVLGPFQTVYPLRTSGF